MAEYSRGQNVINNIDESKSTLAFLIDHASSHYLYPFVRIQNEVKINLKSK